MSVTSMAMRVGALPSPLSGTQARLAGIHVARSCEEHKTENSKILQVDVHPHDACYQTTLARVFNLQEEEAYLG